MSHVNSFHFYSVHFHLIFFFFFSFFFFFFSFFFFFFFLFFFVFFLFFFFFFSFFLFFFFFNDTATTEIYTLSLHDALPICFYPVYGFVGCVVLVLVAKWMRSFLMRPEDYYDEDKTDMDVKQNAESGSHDVDD